jgi:hypothetical protein
MAGERPQGRKGRKGKNDENKNKNPCVVLAWLRPVLVDLDATGALGLAL